MPIDPHDEVWLTRASRTEAAQTLAREIGVPEAIAAILLCRGLETAQSARAFLTPSLAQMHSPLLMLGMSTAVKRIRAALLAGEPILIYGDYDVDGTVATVLLKTALERAARSLSAVADVRFHIPHRIREGYGIQGSRLAEAAAQGVRLVISVDTGIRAFAAADEAKRLGLDLIVTDHHLPEASEGVPEAAVVPEAVAVLNPNQPGCPYPYKSLCGAAVAFKLAQAVLESSARGEDDLQKIREKLLPSFLKLLAIATIADAVPLTGENRVIAALGLRELRRPSQPGLRKLMELASIDLAFPISAFDVGFRIAPRINAAGRMDVASEVVELFFTQDAVRARSLAEKLHRLNDDRRATEAEALRAIELRLKEMAEAEGGLPAAIVLDDAPTTETTPLTNAAPATEGAVAFEPQSPTRKEGAAAPARWHRGVLGILASRVVDRTGLPALVLTHEASAAVTENASKEVGSESASKEVNSESASEAHGSGRSVEGFHLLDALTAIHHDSPLFTRFGGHAHAVGFALPSANVPDLRQRLAEYAASRRPSTPEQPTRHCDVEVRLSEITPDFIAALEQLGPFGNGNPEPVLLARNVRLAQPARVISNRHARFTLEDADGSARLGGMAWERQGQTAVDFLELLRRYAWAQGAALDVSFRLCRNRHPDFGGWEMEIVALRNAQATSSQP